MQLCCVAHRGRRVGKAIARKVREFTGVGQAAEYSLIRPPNPSKPRMLVMDAVEGTGIVCWSGGRSRKLRCGAVLGVVADVTLEYPAEVPLVEDKEAVSALAASGAHPAFRDRVGVRCPDWRATTSTASKIINFRQP